MKKFINIKLNNTADHNTISSFELEILEGADDLNEIVNAQGYVPVKGDMIYLLPGVNIPRVKLKDLALSLGIRVVRDPAKANVIFAGRNSVAKITSSRWAYKVSSTFALERIKEICDDGFYIQNLETAITSTGETDIFGSYDDITNIIAHNTRNEYNSSYIYTIDPEYSEMYTTVKSKTIYSETELLNNINGDDSTTINEEVFEQLKNMFDSSDTDNHVLAMEIMANSKYEDSILYLLMLISENAYKINNSNTRNHVNFKSMLTYFGWQPRDVTHINTDNIVEMIDNKGLLTVDMIKRLYQEYSEDIIRNIYYDDVFEVKEVTIKQEYLEKLNLGSINLINPEEVSVITRPDPVEIEEEILEDELIEAAFTNIERNKLKSELIALETDISDLNLEGTENTLEENLTKTKTNDTDIDWF
jgi:hypothetical protein